MSPPADFYLITKGLSAWYPFVASYKSSPAVYISPVRNQAPEFIHLFNYHLHTRHHGTPCHCPKREGLVL